MSLNTHMTTIRSTINKLCQEVQSGQIDKVVLGLRKLEYQTWEIELAPEEVAEGDDKPKRHRRTKAEIEAEKAGQSPA